ncbi:MarR family winged helix-turn-helix transcriptional regulator [Cytobacillus purgationiresistens]|uniref:DNA-binding MarR family transcriptional regulator n=1 Tax=Cytobacillus purgationiresistens TaxID=863449 RepID=A0ABU0AGE7_9BACI|nr:MarR family winged helix-turn-helix transcriptional regulator [Cytobacillus purgationiresistens]MDQ0269165.1 DNA-binding MarR family transcriptional regulator [Cytobacillus purgationiresistens]
MSENNIQEIKKFNRFYTRVMGIFNLYTDKSPFSATEALILFEIHARKNCTAAFLSNYFGIDKSYMSRIIKHFGREGLTIKEVSQEDRRVQHIFLTELGRSTLNSLANKASINVESMIEGIPEDQIDHLIDSMKSIQKILYKNI